MLKKYGILTNGKFIKGESGRYFNVINPATQKTISKVASATSNDVDMVVENALNAFSVWKNTTRTERAAILNKIADKIESELENLVQVDVLDTGRCYGESVIHHKNAVAEFRYIANAIGAYEETFIQHDNDTCSIVVREPLGVAAMILPWNAPSMLFGWKVAPALAAGNTVVIKPASAAPLSVMELGRICQEILPPGVLNIIAGSGEEVGDYLINHPKIAKISFTGSTETGRNIGKIAGNNIIPCSLELGGKSANIVFPDAPMERAIQYAAIAILSSAGEVCVAGSRLFLHEDIYDSFLSVLKEKFEKVKVGNPALMDTQMGPVIDESQMNKVLEYIEIGKKEGARLLCGGKRLTGGQYNKGYFIAPTIFADVDNSMRIAREEIFGPVLVAIRFRDEEEVVKMANDSPYGLAAGIWTSDLARAMKVTRSLQAGLVWVNDFLAAIGPFGGYKKSGLGREVHKMAIDYYSNIKNIVMSTSTFAPPAF